MACSKTIHSVVPDGAGNGPVARIPVVTRSAPGPPARLVHCPQICRHQAGPALPSGFMSTVLSASAPASFEIKSANLPLVALLLKSADLAHLADELKQRFGDMPDFFDQDALLVDLSPLQASAEADAPVDFPA